MRLYPMAFIIFFSFNTFAYQYCPGQELGEDFSVLEKQDNFMQTVTQLSCVESFNQQQTAGKHNYTFGVCESGKFKLDINTTFPNTDSVEDVFNNYFLDGNKVNQASNLLLAAPKINNSVAPKVADLKGLKTYEMVSVPTKDSTPSTLYSNCSMVLTGTTKIVQTCKINLAKGDAADAFDSGDNSTVIACEKKDTGVDCKITVNGNTKPYSAYLGTVYRSAERLAVSGAIETMYDMYNLSYMDHAPTGCKPGDVSVGFKKTNLHLNKLNNFWGTGVEKAKAQDGSSSKLTMSSSATHPTTYTSHDDCK